MILFCIVGLLLIGWVGQIMMNNNRFKLYETIVTQLLMGFILIATVSWIGN